MPHRAEQYEWLGRLYRQLCGVFREDAVELFIQILSETKGGERVTIPSQEVLCREARNIRIRKNYDSGEYSYSELAAKYDLNRRQVSRILNKESMFGKEDADEISD